MKKFIFVFLLVLIGSFPAPAQKAAGKEKSETQISKQPTLEREAFDPTKNPEADLQQTIVKAQASSKRIILDVGGEWCGWCRLMDKFFSQNPELAKLRDENYIWIKVNFSEENENKEFLSKYPAIPGYPHLFVLEKDGTLLKSQDTVELEAEKTYDLQKFTDFLQKWSPPKNTGK